MRITLWECDPPVYGWPKELAIQRFRCRCKCQRCGLYDGGNGKSTWPEYLWVLKFLLEHRPTKEMPDEELAELAPWSEKLQSIKNRKWIIVNYSNSQRAGVILYLDAVLFGAYLVEVQRIRTAWHSELLHRRRKRSSTIFCSQYDSNGWYDQLGGDDSPLSEAILDRIKHDAYKINIIPMDPANYKSMREVYGLDPALSE